MLFTNDQRILPRNMIVRQEERTCLSNWLANRRTEFDVMTLAGNAIRRALNRQNCVDGYDTNRFPAMAELIELTSRL
jgi:hypothetical protein